MVNMKQPDRSLCCILLCIAVGTWNIGIVNAAVPEVSSVTPQCGSINGGTRVTVYGTNFARNFFNFGAGNEDLGSKVRLSALKSYDCEIHPDGSHETQIMCYTPPMPEGEYDVKVSVDGEDVASDKYCDDEDDCKFTVSNDCTPTITSITPVSGMPGNFLEITGDIITTKYGSNEPDEFENIILRAYFGGQKCELRDLENDELYGITLDDNEGWMKCLTEGTYIGNNEVSFLVSNEYGRSKPAGSTQHVHRNGIGMYQTYTEISGLSQNQGSTSGGTRITISGQHFDETVTSARIMVGGEECTMEEDVADALMVCSTPADASTGTSHFTGGRGFYAYVVNGSSDPSSIDKSTAEVQHVDSSSWSATGWPSHALVMEGYFIPVYTGSYKFCLKAASTATFKMSSDHDPNNKATVISGSGSSCDGRESSIYSLTQDNKYYMEVEYGSSASNSFVSVVAHLMETTLAEEDTGMAEHEIQDLKFTSTVTKEIQKITVSSSGSASASNQDVQEITISGNPDAYFAVGLDGIFTAPIQLSAVVSGDDITSELTGLPNVDFEVQVEVQTQGSNTVLVISSDSSTGPISLYNATVVGGSSSDLSFSFSRTTEGSPSLETFALTMDGIPTSPIPVGASNNEVKSALEELFGVRCHPKLSSGKIFDFESDADWITGRVSDEEPFCGRYSAKNPRYIYSKGNAENAVGVRVASSTNRFMCLAYRGLAEVNKVRVAYSYTDTNNLEEDGTIQFDVNNDNPQRWSYWCEDIFALIDAKVTGTGIVVQYAQAFRRDTEEDLFIDHVLFNRERPLDEALLDGVMNMRLPQVQPNDYFIDTISVSSTGSPPSEYDIELTPHHCGHNLPLFEVAAASRSGSTYTISNGGSVTVRVQQEQTASPPIEGTYKVIFNDQRSPNPIPVTVELDPDNVVANLNAMNVGFSEVTESGTCSEFTYRVKMVSHTGNQPLMEVDDSLITGTDAQVTVETVRDGGLWFDPIMGDLLRTHHTTPQIIAFINEVPTKCVDQSSCSFQWDTGFTPSVSSVSPTSGSMGASVQISGSGFDGSTVSNNEVVIGTTPCTVTAATSSSIDCTLDNGPTGSASVNVIVAGKGLAAGSVTFTYVTGVTTFTPSPGSVEGGSLLTLDGFGFTPDAIITLDGNECVKTEASESQIQCKTPRAASASTTQTFDVIVTQAGSSVTAGQFTYNPSLTYTPVISAISTSSSNVWGGDAITITGQGFGGVEMPVTLGGENLTVTSYTDTQIEAELPALSHGSYKLIVDVEDKGYADLRTNTIPDIDYVFKITSMTPTLGSMYGGTDVLITGQGFTTNTSLIDVALGPHACEIQSVTSTTIKCRIADTGINHDIAATGTHKNYGVGYAWDKDPHTVSVGDYVTWHWETPFYVSDIDYAVHQTATASDLTNMPDGFTSGVKNRKGSFQHRFTVPGTYFYWTGYMDTADVIFFRGTINVVELESSSQALSVSMMGHEALYDTAGTVVTDSPSCTSVTATLSGCSDSASLTPEAGKFNFDFKKCYSPFIDTISRNNGTFSDEITMTGDGLGDTACQNEVLFSEASCTTTRSSATSVGFQVSAADFPPVGVLHEFSMRVGNLGYALITVQGESVRRFGLLPEVTGISPFEGSKVGGTKLTVSGAGFEGTADDMYIDLTRMSCEVESANYTTIICETNCGSTPASCYTGVLTATVTVSGMLADCEDPNCNFLSLESRTATVSSISPNSVSAASTSLTIAGTGFGTSASDVRVAIGGETCAVSGSVTDTQITCTVGRLPVGDNDVDVYIANNGKAATTETVASVKSASISVPSASSTNGGAVMVITGNGFVEDDTSVDISGSDCPVVSVAFDEVTCTLPAKSAGTENVVVTSNGVTYDTVTLTYSSAATPNVASTSPSGGQSGSSITISGSGFTSPAGSDPTVVIGDVECAVTSSSASSITCTLGVQHTGAFAIQVFVEQAGYSNDDVTFTYELGSFSINPSLGSTNGGQLVTLTGSGFLENDTSVTICGQECTEVSLAAGEYVCRTPSGSAGSCDVVATAGSVSKTNAGAYTYDASLVSTVTGVNPTRGGTGGGTVITITGTNFGSTPSDIGVEINGAVCTVETVANTQITCRTGSATSADALVEVQRNGWGLAQQISAAFEYIDMWSSPYTWGGASPPAEGDFVIIPAGQKILLDTDTEIMKMLLIQGGQVIFDEANVELQSENILITDGGLLQAGTEDSPFPEGSKAIITLHGILRSKELPIYGTKTLGVREGTLNLYGQPTVRTWTHLDSTATAGASTITLQQAVDWHVGDEIVIATTGDRHSQKESEVHVIQSVSGDGLTLTLEEPLAYEHIGISGTFGGTTVDFRAEVGLLTHNVVVRGNRNTNFDTEIEACPAGFNTGEFATQTCFQGRFGEELGSDQFGAQVMIHQAVKDTQVAQAHLQFVEFTHVGQAFRMGRYPVHFHLNGNMDKSFVRGCSIHTSFNRAVNIHGTHNAMVEHNVIYNTMGGSFFLEDGDETGNTFQYNLAVFVRSSTSLRNDDITPAAFWATNPNNTISHNAAAGGTHFGTWYRMHTHPEGPGFDASICPQSVPLGEYRNNSAHSLGWFGLWIFEKYVPRVDASCSSSAAHQVAQFYSLTAWNCEKGAEAVDGGALQFREFVLVNNDFAGYEGKKVVDNPPIFDSANGPGLFDSLIVSHYANLRGKPTHGGVVMPYLDGFMIENTEFYNFDQFGKAGIRWTRIDGTCSFFCGGFRTEVNGLTFVDSPNKVRFEWESEGVIYDADGSLTGNTGYSVAACTPSFNQSQCKEDSGMSAGISGCICSDEVKLIRFSFNHPLPESLLYKDAVFVTEHGQSNSPWAEKRITHKEGWSMVLMANNYYNFSFENADHITNISYDSQFSSFDTGDFVVFTQFADQQPDIFMLDGSNNLNMSETMLSGTGVSHGDWFYSVPDLSLTYTVKRAARKKRAASVISSTKFNINARAIRCFYRGCSPPPDPMDVLDEPSHKEFWSDPATWVNFTHDGLEPGPNDDLSIPKDKWIIVDQEIPVLGKVTIEGGLQFLNNESMNILLEADYIYVTGRLIMGWSEQDPFRGQATIRLRGHHRTPVYPTTDGPTVGAKFIAIFGGLQLHGVDRGLTKSRLAATVNAGDNTITVKDDVAWTINDEIVITTTDYSPTHTETFKISAISGKTITLNDTLRYRHVAHAETINGHDIEVSAFVGLLTRNIKVEGEDYSDLYEESFGARVIVGQTFDHLGAHSGFAQISNVEFYHTGQEGFSENYDARFSVTYSDVTTTEGEVRYSFVRKNSFHHGFNAAVGVFGVDNLEVDDNVIHHTVGTAIRTESVGTRVTNNLVALNLWPGSYQDREESLNMDYDGAIDATLATDLVLVNNSVYGSERSAYKMVGQPCSTASGDLWSNNIGASSMMGSLIFPGDTPADSTCLVYSGFTMWKNVDYGVYHNNAPSTEIRNNILVENGVGVMPLVNGPSATAHSFAAKSAIVENNIFVGKTSSFSESDDVVDTSDPNIALSGKARGGGGTGVCGKAGLVMGTFSSGGNNAPSKPFAGIMTYQAIMGHTEVTGNTFAGFGSCTGGRDHALTTNGKNDDGCHPVFMSGNTLVNVEEGSTVFYHRPNVGKINSADCVDMDCDGLKKCLIHDSEGGFLGSPGAVLPDSAYQWDGDRKHGLGDYRIPLVMLTAPNGQKIDVNSYAPNKGVFKTDNCTFMSDWQAYKCQDTYDYRVLTIESMDGDTETRRLSPVALYHPEGYVDLINGPQDHGWCSGYTCRKRLSTFQGIVALDEPFDIFLSSTNPKHMRYMMLSAQSDECVRLGMWYMSSNRLEVSVDGTVVLPTNGYIDGSGGFRLRLQDTNHQYMPDARNKSNGQNFISRAESMIFWVQCGTSVIEVVQMDVLIMSFTLPAMSVDDFFGDQIVRNLAAFLDMDPNKVRIVDIVEDTSGSGRKKRQVGTTIFYVEIGDAPGDANTIDYSDVASTLCNQAHLYSFDDVINATVLYTAIQEPGSPGAQSGQMITLQKTGQLVMDTVPVGDVQEGQDFSVQPKLKVTDSNGDVVSYLGAITSPWLVDVSIKSGGSPRAQLAGNTSVTFVDGWANFTNLAISNRGDYILEFNIMSPPEASNYSVESLAVSVLGRNVGPKAVMKTSNRITGLPIQMEVLLTDKDTNQDVTDIEWANHTWTATASIYDTAFYSGTLGGLTTASFDPSTGKATFINLQLDRPGKCPVLVTITSDPADYEVQMVALIDVMSSAQKNMIVAEMHTLELKYPLEYDTDRADYWTAQVRNHYSDNSELRITGDGHRSGSFVVSLNVQGTATGYNDTLNAMCDAITNGTTFTFDNTTVAMSGYLTVDGVSYYGTSCGQTSDDGDDDEIETVYIAVIAVLSLIIIILVSILLAYKLYFHPHAKTYDSQNAKYLGNNKRGDFLPDCLERDGTFTSLKSRPFSPPMPPVGTLITSKSFVLDIQTPGRPTDVGTPEPEIPGTPTSLHAPTVRTITPQPTPATERAVYNKVPDNGQSLKNQMLLANLSLAMPKVDKPPTPEMKLNRANEQRPSVVQPEWNF